MKINLKEIDQNLNALIESILDAPMLEREEMKTKILIHFNIMNKQVFGEALSDLEKEKAGIVQTLKEHSGLKRKQLENELRSLNLEIKKTNVFLTAYKDMYEYQKLKEVIKAKYGIDAYLELVKNIK
jgi:hypothetical protein